VWVLWCYIDPSRDGAGPVERQGRDRHGHAAGVVREEGPLQELLHHHGRPQVRADHMVIVYRAAVLGGRDMIWYCMYADCASKAARDHNSNSL
jgi:hypothetical protein